jgi:hypothetical protein
MRQGVRLLRALMDEMVETVDVRLELIELIEPPLLRASRTRCASGDQLLEGGRVVP